MKYICSICGYVYDEAKEKAFSDLPADWTCPLCDAPKSDFAPEGGTAVDAAEGVAVDTVSAVSPADAAKPESAPAPTVGASIHQASTSSSEADSDCKKLSAGQRGTLLNLAGAAKSSIFTRKRTL